MRLLLILFFSAFSLPVFAQDWWDSYTNARFGFSIEVPPGFHGTGEGDNGAGQLFLARGSSAEISVWGGHLVISNGDFEQEVTWYIANDIEKGWDISYQAIRPHWASYSGTKGNHILYARMILLCGEYNAYAAFHLQYDRGDKAQFDPIINRLVRTFEAHPIEWKEYRNQNQDFVEAIVNTSARCDPPAPPKLKSRR